MRGAFGQQRNHNKEETILNISLLLRFVYLLRTNRNRPYHTTPVPYRPTPYQYIPIPYIHTYQSGQLRPSFFFLFFVSPFPLSSVLSLFLLQPLTLSVSISDTPFFSFLSPPISPLSSPSSSVSYVKVVSLQSTLW